jgi:hypothetical protein
MLAAVLNFIPYLGAAIVIATLFVVGLLVFPALHSIGLALGLIRPNRPTAEVFAEAVRTGRTALWHPRQFRRQACYAGTACCARAPS